MNDLKFDMRESLPFMLSHPFLVFSFRFSFFSIIHKHCSYTFFSVQITLDFELGYPELDSKALISKWPIYSQRLRLLSEREKKYWVSSIWSPDVEDLLRLLKIFPSKGKSCDKLFKDGAEKFISSCVVSLK